MINLKSNIAFLSADKWRNYVDNHIRQADYEELTANIDYAIESLKMLEQMIKDVATGELVHRVQQFIGEYGFLDENKFDSVANNGEAL